MKYKTITLTQANNQNVLSWQGFPCFLKLSASLLLKISSKPCESYKTNKMTRASSEDSNAQGWSVSSLCALWVAKDRKLPLTDSEASDQTGQMPRPIQIFTEHTGHYVGFVVLHSFQNNRS